MKTGTNALAMRESNEKTILSLVFRGEYSRAELARLTGLTKASVTIITDKLISEGILAEGEKGAYTGAGRKPTALKIVSDSRYIIGVSLEWNTWEVGAIDLGGKRLSKKLHGEIPEDEDTLVKKLASAIAKITEKLGERANVGIGISDGMGMDEDFCRSLSEATGLAVSKETYSAAAALSEMYFGVGEESDDFVFLSVGSDISAGIVKGGKLFRGGENFGHTTIESSGERCECGNVGCLAAYASVPSLVKYRRYESWSEAAGNSGLVRKEAGYLAAGVVTLVSLFGSECIILGGEVAENCEALCEGMREKLSSIRGCENVVITSESGLGGVCRGASVRIAEMLG